MILNPSLDNLAEYATPYLYDAEYGRYQGDFDFFLKLLPNGNVLDLGCGTGRLAIPLTQKGFKVVGLDASLPMLALARQKAQSLPIEWIHGDIREFHLHKTFDLIFMAGNTFQALLTEKDQRHMLDCVRKHLKPSGLFVFNTRNPQQRNLTTTSEFEFWHSFQDHHGENVQVYGTQKADSIQSIITYTTKRFWINRETLTTLQLRFTPYEQLEKRLEQTGFEIHQVFGDDQKNPFHKDSPSIIPVCRLKR